VEEEVVDMKERWNKRRLSKDSILHSSINMNPQISVVEEVVVGGMAGFVRTLSISNSDV